MYASTYLYPQVMRNAAAALKEVIDQMHSSVVLTSANARQREDAALVLHKSYFAEANKVRCKDDDAMLVIPQENFVTHYVLYSDDHTRWHATITCDIVQTYKDLRLVCMHYASIQTKLEFANTGLRAIEAKIQKTEKEFGWKENLVNQKVNVHPESQ